MRERHDLGVYGVRYFGHSGKFGPNGVFIDFSGGEAVATQLKLVRAELKNGQYVDATGERIPWITVIEDSEEPSDWVKNLTPDQRRRRKSSHDKSSITFDSWRESALHG